MNNKQRVTAIKWSNVWSGEHKIYNQVRKITFLKTFLWLIIVKQIYLWFLLINHISRNGVELSIFFMFNTLINFEILLVRRSYRFCFKTGHRVQVFSNASCRDLKKVYFLYCNLSMSFGIIFMFECWGE